MELRLLMQRRCMTRTLQPSCRWQPTPAPRRRRQRCRLPCGLPWRRAAAAAAAAAAARRSALVPVAGGALYCFQEGLVLVTRPNKAVYTMQFSIHAVSIWIADLSDPGSEPGHALPAIGQALVFEGNEGACGLPPASHLTDSRCLALPMSGLAAGAQHCAMRGRASCCRIGAAGGLLPPLALPASCCCRSRCPGAAAACRGQPLGPLDGQPLVHPLAGPRSTPGCAALPGSRRPTGPPTPRPAGESQQLFKVVLPRWKQSCSRCGVPIRVAPQGHMLLGADAALYRRQWCAARTRPARLPPTLAWSGPGLLLLTFCPA
jgi:hypothetical protein